MTATTPLPSLFGRFTAIFKDHARLGTTLRRLRALCMTLEAGARPPPSERPARLLDELYADLKEHFTAEESREYFGTVLEEEPSLAPQIASLKWEHLSMLRTVERLRAAAQDEGQWPALPVPTRELVAELESHERSESVLLRRLFLEAP